MQKLLQISFPYAGPFGKQMAGELAGLAASIGTEPGLVWKIWTENESGHEAGGVYLFADEHSALVYREQHTARLKELGISEITAKIFDINAELSRLTRGPVA